uniref:TBC1 domain family member 2 n=1 Tax=Podarcis muralis TaxID=64176 RepID=A0A670K752_PODMU
MEPDSESRHCLVAGTSSKPEEEKAEDTESGISCALDGGGPPFREKWENVDLKPGRETPKKQLCGYLNKFSAKAPIKTWKSRWFVYDENKCNLLYYRTAQDMNPLGSIELSSASFDLKVGAEEGVFEIRTPSKAFILQAVDKQTMIYWLQQLQIKRWEFCSNQTRSPAEDDTDFPSGLGPTNINLVCLFFPSIAEAEHEFLPPVKTPTDVVGPKAASLPAPLQPSHALQNISLKHPWIEIHHFSLTHPPHLAIANTHKLPVNTTHIGITVTTDQNNLCHHWKAGMCPMLFSSSGATEMQKDPKSRLKPPLVRKDKKESRSLRCFAEGARDGRTASLQHQILVLEEDVKAQKELVKLLHKALEAAQQEKRESCRYLVTAKEEDRLELVRHKVRQIAELNKQVEALEMEKKELEQGLALKDEHIGELKAHVQLLMDKNQAKQQVILKLTEQLARDMPDSVGEADAIPMETLYKQQEEIEHLKDDLEAYKIQNQFLNCEIHQVTKIWSTVAQKEKTLLMKCARLQAHNCQIESKYLMILRKLQGLPDFASEHVEMLKGLIQEALQWGVKEEAMIPVHLSPINQYDDYGFMTIPEYEAADWKLLAKIQALEIKSSNLLNQDAMEETLSDRWNNLGELTPSSELKSLLRCGVPIEHRQRVWRWIVSRRVQHVRSPGHYQNLLQKCEAAEHPASRQIELDLPRTLTNNRHFNPPASQLLPKLRRILLAFSLQNPTIGYCQGLNRLAAIALLVLEEEEIAFWCLVHITENLMPPDYYSNTLIGSQVDQRVFKDFLSEKLPRLAAHLEQHRIDLVIFRYALAIFKYNEEAILRIQDSLEIYQYMRFFTKTICDGRKLMNIAFSDMNPFPMKVLQNRRRVYRLKLESEMRELEQIKVEYMKEQAEHAASNSNGAVSEDEEDM